MVKIIGHRGQRHDKATDDNSLAAFETAFKNCDGIETDVSVSAEDTPFLIHDIGRLKIPKLYDRTVNMLKYCLDRASSKKLKGRRIDQINDDEIDTLRLKKGAKVPRLSELFALAAKYPGKEIDIELKGADALRPVLKEIDKAVKKGQIKRSQITLTSFDIHAIAEAAQLAPDLRRGIIFSGKGKANTPIHPWSQNGKNRFYTGFNSAAVKSGIMKTAAPDVAVMHASNLNAKKIKMLKTHFPNIKIAIWESAKKPPAKNKALKKLLSDPKTAPHISAVITDHPKELAKM
ncbi:MAG: hypothetical protein EP349_07050, partial [Alphaproteobacteria bacterium]